MALSPVGIRYVSTGVRPFLGNLIQARRQISQFSSSGAALGQSLGNIGRQATAAGLGLTFFATVPIVTALFGAVKAASAFEDELVKLSTLSGLAQTEIDGIRKGILSLAPALGKVPVELAEAAFFITSTGDLRNAAEALEVLEVSAKASAIGLGETSDIASAITSVMAAYGKENITAAHAADVLGAAVDRGKFETEEFAPAIGRVLGLTSQMGVSFEEASNFIATFSLVGVTAAQATTSLQRTLISILKPTKAAREELAGAGVSIEALQRSVAEDGLTAALLGLKQQFDDTGQNFARFFTRVTGLTGVLVNTGEAADLFIDNLQAIGSATGFIERGFATVQQSTSFQVDQLKASFGVLGTTIGSVLLPAVNTAVARIIPLVIAISDFAAQNPKLVLIATSFALIAAALGPLLLIVGFAITTLSSLIGIVSTIGGALLTLLPPVALIVAAFASLGAIIAAVVQHRFREAGTTFEQFATNALNWGKNITINLARGLIAGAVAVVNALIQIGNVIAGWLAPGSPPRLLPDLPEWGASAMSEYLEGFTSADFSVFDTLASTIEGFMRNLSPADNIELVPDIMNVREILAQAINDVNNLAVVNDATVSAIVSGYGIAQGAVFDYIVTMLQLAEAQERVKEIQEEINDVNTEFDANIAPLNEELKAIRDRRDEVEEQMRIDELESILADPNAPELAKELALMELREIELQNQIDAQEEARDAALEGLEEQLAAAEAEAAALEERAAQQEALIAAQEKQNELMQEQIELLKKLAKELDDVGDALGDAGGGVGDVGSIGAGGLDVPTIDPLEGLLGEGFTSVAEDIKTSIEELVDDIKEDLKEPFDGLIEKWEELGKVWSNVFDLATDRFNEFVGTVGGKIDSFVAENRDAFRNFKINAIRAFNDAKIIITETFRTVVQTLGGYWDTIVEGARDIGSRISAFFSENAGFFEEFGRRIGIAWIAAVQLFNVLLEILKPIFDGIVSAVGSLITGILNIVKFVMAVITLQWGEAWEAIKQVAISIWEAIKAIVLGVLGSIATLFGTNLEALGETVRQGWEIIKFWVVSKLNEASIAASRILLIIGGSIALFVKNAIEFFRNLWETAKTTFSDNLETIRLAVATKFDEIKTNITTQLTSIRETFYANWNLIKERTVTRFEEIKQTIRTKIQEAKDAVIGFVSQFVSAGESIIDGLKDGVINKAEGLVAAVSNAVLRAIGAALGLLNSTSPSKVFMEIGEDTMIGMAMGILAKAQEVATAMQMAIAPAIPEPSIAAPSVALPARIAASQAGGSQSNTFGPNYINNGMDEAVFAEKVRRVVTGGL